MHISVEEADKHAVQAYDTTQIQVNSIIYTNSFIVCRDQIISDLPIHNIQEVNEEYISLILKLEPELIIIGHQNTGAFPPMDVINQLSQKRVGIEFMTIGAACRTYNVLLSEQRAVVSGFILE